MWFFLVIRVVKRGIDGVEKIEVNKSLNGCVPQATKHPFQAAFQVSKMSSYSKKFVTSFLRDSVSMRSMSLVKLFPMGEALQSPYDNYSLQEVKVVEPNYDTYTVITINPITMEEQLSTYPVVVIHKMPGAPNTVIDIE